MAIKFMKLIDGSDIVADVTEENENYSCKNTVMLGFQETERGIGLGMSPLHFVKDNIIRINKDKIVYEGEPADEIKNAYNAQYGSGIVTASNLKIHP